VLRVIASDVTENWLADRLAELGPSEELAWHSWVDWNGVGFHIPMIDFQGMHAAQELMALEPILRTASGSSFTFFKTGRSFHGYSVSLISQSDWLQYLGRLLLLNELERPAIVDTRWIGHSLVRGFAALRWSHNTDRYQAMPHLLKSS
jgi:hypothetical protein